MVPIRAEGEAVEHRERTLDAVEHRRTTDATEDRAPREPGRPRGISKGASCEGSCSRAPRSRDRGSLPPDPCPTVHHIARSRPAAPLLGARRELPTCPQADDRRHAVGATATHRAPHAWVISPAASRATATPRRPRQGLAERLRKVDHVTASLADLNADSAAAWLRGSRQAIRPWGDGWLLLHAPAQTVGVMKLLEPRNERVVLRPDA